MKKPVILIMLIVITAFAFGAVYFRQALVSENAISDGNKEHEVESSEKPETDSPDLAYQWRSLAWKDQNGHISGSALGQAIAQRDAYLLSQKISDGYPPGVIANFNWVSRGPQNVGGRTRSIIIHPNNSNIIWAGSVGGGVWKSGDAGQTWTASNSSLMNFAVSSMAIDPNNPNIPYAGTGEGFFNADAIRGGGIFKTTDGGMTWTPLLSTVPLPDDDFNWTSVDRIAISPTNNNIILVATRGGIKRSINGGGSWTVIPLTFE